MKRDIHTGLEMLKLAIRQLNELTFQEVDFSREEELVMSRALVSRAYFSVFWIARGVLVRKHSLDLSMVVHGVHSKLRKEIESSFNSQIGERIGRLFRRRVDADYEHEELQLGEVVIAIEAAREIAEEILDENIV